MFAGLCWHRFESSTLSKTFYSHARTKLDTGKFAQGQRKYHADALVLADPHAFDASSHVQVLERLAELVK